METTTTVEVAAVIDTDGIDLTTWTAVGLGKAKGFTAVGPSFQAARLHFAEVIALAIANDVLDPGCTPTSIRVIASTRKTFPLDQLLETP